MLHTAINFRKAVRQGLLVLLCSLTLAFPATAQNFVYVVSEKWEVTKIKLNPPEVVDTFEIIPPGPLEIRHGLGSILYVPEWNSLFVGNYSAGFNPAGAPPELKIMKVDLSKKISTPFFYDQEILLEGEPPSLVLDPGEFYYSTASDLLYVCYEYPSIAYILDRNGEIKRAYTEPEVCPGGNPPPFQNKVYGLATGTASPGGSIYELDLTTLSSRTVLDNLAYVGGDPYSSADLWFISQDEKNADFIIADKKTKRYQVEKPQPPDPPLWRIVSEEEYSYDIRGRRYDDVAGYKEFVNHYLTIDPFDTSSGPYTFWVFDATQNPMPLVYEVSVPKISEAWTDIPPDERPNNLYPPTVDFVPDAGRPVVIAQYTSKRGHPCKFLILDAQTSQVRGNFYIRGGIAGVFFTEN